MSTLPSSSDNPIFDELLAEFEARNSPAATPVKKAPTPRKKATAAKAGSKPLGRGIAALIPTEPKEQEEQ